MVQRIRLMDTSSWRELDAGWRDRLVWLHDDYYFRRQEALWKANALRTLPVRPKGSAITHEATGVRRWTHLQHALQSLPLLTTTIGHNPTAFPDGLFSFVINPALSACCRQVLMRATDMLVCGEDLGMIPACVPPVMEQLGLVGASCCPCPESHLQRTRPHGVLPMHLGAA